eukprot:CAMPEP_0197174584 /NCGR_PEP_ID=MMETSP1423-20130617/1038_1 /TAXON_ID=476441 /ORGANISM="Pseudo-nitzschia heimii, Strain UNC1101" /LENGTH=249 /DNA_ID=CAMNT_0042623527 /DNA_START=144 /DNA_END=893 /DNA_ORIENTATION=-
MRSISFFLAFAALAVTLLETPSSAFSAIGRSSRRGGSPASASSSASVPPSSKTSLSVSVSTPPYSNGTIGIKKEQRKEEKFGPSEKLLTLFNRQVTQEFMASQAYLSASIWFDIHDWEGQAAYMLAESAEERLHGLGFVEFAMKRNIPIELQAIPAPPVPSDSWDRPEDVWQSILELEQTNTRSLLDLAEAANDCNDFSTLAFLNPYHLEQVSEEDKIGGILAKVRDENQTPGLLRSLDAELGGEAHKN